MLTLTIQRSTIIRAQAVDLLQSKDDIIMINFACICCVYDLS